MSDRKYMVSDSCNLDFGKVYKDVKSTLEVARSKSYSAINPDYSRTQIVWLLL